MSVWLCQIAKNLWSDQCRKNKKIANLSEEDLINQSYLFTNLDEIFNRHSRNTKNDIL